MPRVILGSGQVLLDSSPKVRLDVFIDTFDNSILPTFKNLKVTGIFAELKKRVKSVS